MTREREGTALRAATVQPSFADRPLQRRVLRLPRHYFISFRQREPRPSGNPRKALEPDSCENVKGRPSGHLALTSANTVGSESESGALEHRLANPPNVPTIPAWLRAHALREPFPEPAGVGNRKVRALTRISRNFKLARVELCNLSDECVALFERPRSDSVRQPLNHSPVSAKGLGPSGLTWRRGQSVRCCWRLQYRHPLGGLLRTTATQGRGREHHLERGQEEQLT